MDYTFVVEIFPSIEAIIHPQEQEQQQQQQNATNEQKTRERASWSPFGWIGIELCTTVEISFLLNEKKTT